MSIWQAQDGSLHDDDDGRALNHPQWPQGMKKLTDAQAKKVQDAQSASTPESVRADRDSRVQAVAWRYQRLERYKRAGLSYTDELAKLDAYVQALCDVPQQKGFPTKVVWPKDYQ